MCSKTLPIYVARFIESKVPCVSNYRLGFIRNKDKNTYVYVLYNNVI